MTNNDSLAIENFISFCDEMMIAEEGIGNTIKNMIKSKRKKMNKETDDSISDAIQNMHKITEEIHSKCVSIIKSKHLNVNISKVYFKNYSNEAEAYFTYKINTDNTDQYSSILHELWEGMGEIMRKHKDVIDKYNIQDVNEGEYFALFIEDK